MKKLIYLLPPLLLSCGPSAEEIEIRNKIKAESIITTTLISEPKIEQPRIQKYFIASDFGLVAGTIVGWAPTDEAIGEMRCAGGEEPDTQIYIHIQNENGKVSVIPCDYKTWINLTTGDNLK